MQFPGLTGAARLASQSRMTRSTPLPTRPLRIGISARLLYQVPPELGFRNKTLQYLEQSLAHWIMEHGAMAFMVPAVAEDSRRAARHLSVDEYVAELDGLVLQGGADVAPQTYGQEPIDPRWSGDPVRDRYELALLRSFLDQGKPVIGVCRGCQLLNVAFGGTLYQDLQTQCPNTHRHVDSELYDQFEHDITFLQGSQLAQLYPKSTQLRVTSIHHQAVDQLGKQVVVEAVSSLDGVASRVPPGPSHPDRQRAHHAGLPQRGRRDGEAQTRRPGLPRPPAAACPAAPAGRPGSRRRAAAACTCVAKVTADRSRPWFHCRLPGPRGPANQETP
jgi:putative glutamine amidotransferase